MIFLKLPKSYMLIIIGILFTSVHTYSRELKALQINQTPVIDGKLTEKCWSKAQVANQFRQLRTFVLAKEQTEAYVLYDKNNLYFGFKCHEPEMAKLKEIAKKNKSVFKYNQGENIEIFLQPRLDSKKILQFLVNSNSTSMELCNSEMQTGTLQWEKAVFMGKDFFSVEIKIPFAIIHLQAGTGQEWGMNLCRGRMITGGRSAPFSSWNKVQNSFRNPKDFGRLQINNDFSRFFYAVKLVSETNSGAEDFLEITNLTGKAKQLFFEVSLVKNKKKQIQTSGLLKLLKNGKKRIRLKSSGVKNHNLMKTIILKEKESGIIIYQGSIQNIDVTKQYK